MAQIEHGAGAPYERCTAEEFARRGDEVFERMVRPRVEGHNAREFVAIDVETGAYEIARDELTAIEGLRARHPQAAVWVRRVGSRHAHRFGAGRAHSLA